MEKPVLPLLKSYLSTILPEVSEIDLLRKIKLNAIIDYIRHADNPRLNFICTHNSRRSQMGQVWAHVAANYFNIHCEAFSGGTEATAFHTNAIGALARAGFEIQASSNNNPKVTLRFSKEVDPIVCFSKTYDDDANPKENFAAIMTCSEADQECPVVFGAAERIKLLYEDPKEADGTSTEEAKYDERCRQIAIEMFYVFSNVK